MFLYLLFFLAGVHLFDLGVEGMFEREDSVEEMENGEFLLWICLKKNVIFKKILVCGI